MQDHDLIREYVEKRSEQSFACLMERHMGLVYQTCKRQVGDADLARDAAKATFLILAQKAPSLLRQKSLSAWLFTVVRLTAQRTGSAPSCLPASPAPGRGSKTYQR